MRKSSLLCIVAIVITHILAYYAVLSYKPEINTSLLIKEIVYSGVILLMGSSIMYIKFKNDQFVARFMILTIFQILAILTFVVALVYTKTQPLRLHALLFLFTYLSGMVVQTAFFLRFSKETS